MKWHISSRLCIISMIFFHLSLERLGEIRNQNKPNGYISVTRYVIFN